MRTSYSALQTYNTCPLKFKYQEIDRIKVPKSKEAVFGTAVHAALRRMFTHDPLYPALDEVVDFFSRTWEEARARLTLSTEQAAAYRIQGATLLTQFYKKNPPWNFHVLDLESRFEVVLEDPGAGEAHIVAGVIDRIDKLSQDRYEIIDYKTARRMPSQEGLDNDLQMSIYHLGLLRKWPHLQAQNIVLSLHFLKHGEKISTVRAETALTETRGRILKTLREIRERARKDDFPPTPSALCDWCGYRAICPVWRHLYQDKESQVKNQEELAPVLKEYISLKSANQTNNLRLRELQGKIQDFMEREGLLRVFSEQGFLTKSERSRPVYDMEKVRAVLSPIGKWEEILKTDEKKLQILAASLPQETREALQNAITEVKTITTLSLSQKRIAPPSSQDPALT